MIRTSEVTEPCDALERILDIISRYSTLTAADREIIRAANRGLLGTDPYGRWEIELLTEEEQTNPKFMKRYRNAGLGFFDGRKYLDGTCWCHAPHVKHTKTLAGTRLPAKVRCR